MCGCGCVIHVAVWGGRDLLLLWPLGRRLLLLLWGRRL